MFDVINRYAHGFIAVPVIAACKRRGLFATLAEHGPMTAVDLVKIMKANEGYFHVGLRLLESLEWLSKDGQMLSVGRAVELDRVPENIEAVYRIPLAQTLRVSGSHWAFGEWLERSRQGWDGASPLMTDLLDGTTLLPLFLELEAGRNGGSPFAFLEEPARGMITGLFVERGWAQGVDAEAVLTPAGRMLLEQSMIGGSTVSYKPMLYQMEELLFGDHKGVFTRASDDAEEHVDRSLNVRASGFQHQKYFRDIRKLAVDIFDREPLAAQPRYLMDTGSGDGSLLRSIYDAVVGETLRGRSLDRYPLTLIGVDYNAHARAEAARTLEGTPFRMMFGDIADPQGIERELRNQGIEDLDQILHIRSFLDHDRPFREPCEVQTERAIPTDAVAVDQEGMRVSPLRATASLTEFLRGWSGLIGHRGILIAEVHAVDAGTAGRFIDECESLHYDAFHGFSRQHLVEPEVYLLAAGRVGLFPRPGSSRRYPREFQYTRITIHHFEKRPYRIRHAKAEDIDALIEIDRQCWQSAMRTPSAEIRRRVESFPDEQFVVEQEGQAIGVCYTQPVPALDDLRGAVCRDLPALRCAKGRALQLLGLNVLPEKRSSGLGDQLLEFVLEYARCSNAVDRVVGVSRCSSYDARTWGGGIEAYVRSRGAGGQLLDPVLSFHESHGADIIGLVANFRPEDVDNDSYGVLIHYDLMPASRQAPTTDANTGAGSVPAADIGATIEGFVHVALGGDDAQARPSLSRTQPFMEMGLASMQILKLRALLSEHFHQPLDSAFLFRHGSIEAVAAALRPSLAQVSAPVQVPVPHADRAHEAEPIAPGVVAAQGHVRDQDIAVVGIACRFPGGGPEGFWRLLRDGVDGVRDVPAERWWWRTPGDALGAFQRAGYIDHVDAFDPGFFRMAPVEAELLDPQQRLLLELTWEVLEDSGHSPKSMRGSSTGVWIGCCHFDYRELSIGTESALSGHTATGTFGAMLANRLSYFYDFKGPSVTVDTACSSALVALHTAVQSLRRGECEQALIGGANLICTPTNTTSFARAGMLSPTGQCSTFDGEANGYVRGEGVGLVMLKPLARALADGDQIYGVIAGSAVNHGGEANSLTSPNPSAQRDVIMSAYLDAGLSPADVDYVEAHGTGTKLGDPIEMMALSEAFETLLARTNEAPHENWSCAVGSAKTNIGHLEGAAGIAGLIKVLLAIRHASLPGNLHFKSLNPHLNLAGSPFRIVASTRPWERLSADRARCAGVSSFGFGGVSAHVLVREFQAGRRRELPAGSQLVPLSARSELQLRETCVRLEGFLRERSVAGQSLPQLEDIAWTLQVGRTAMDERVALLCESVQDLQQQLRRYLDGEQDARIYRSRAAADALDDAMFSGREGREFVRIAIESGNLGKLARLWTQGIAIDWPSLHVGRQPLRVSLPTYPFAKERYWISRAAEGGARFGALQLHPLLHENTSDLSEQSYRTRFSGEEFYLSDHRVRLEGQLHKVLPAVVYLEMARAAVERASGAVGAGQVLELRETVWLRPVRVDGERALSIALEAQADGAVGYEIYSEEGAQDSVVHCQGRAVYVAEPAVGRVDVAALRGRCAAGRLTGEELYGRLEGMGLSYGAGHRAIEWLEQGAGELCARLSVPLSVQGEWQQYGLHPSLLDGALQACVGLLQEQSRAAQPWVPYAVEQVRAVRACAQQMWVWARWTAGGEGRSLDVELCDEQGAVCVQLRGFTARPLVAQSVQPVPAVEAPVGLLLARPVWRSSEALGGGEVYERRLVLLCELTQVQAQRLEGLLPGSECRELSAQGDVAQRYGEQAVQCFEQLREVLRSKPRGKVLVQVVAGQSERGGFSAGLTGLLRTAQQENPQLVGQVVMVEEGISEAQLAQRLSREPGAQVAAQVRYRGGEREVCGWQEEVLGGEGLPLVWKERGIYVLSGGLGGLGMLLARQVLSQTTQGQVVLVGRGELTESKRQQLAGLWPTAGRVHYRQADVADAQQVRELLEGVCREHGGLDGIVHGAGVKADNFIVKKTSEEFREVLRAKVQGVCNLDQASRALELDFLVLFSSVAGALGNVGQADYAAGNGFLDRYAEYRNELVRRGERHGRTVSINWPLWAEGGMQMEAASLEWLQRETGMRPLETPAGLQALQRALQLSAGQVLVLEGERERLRAALGLVRPAPALAAVAALAAVPAASSAAVSEPVSGNELLERTQEYLREQLAGQLHLAAHRIDPQAPLEQYGIDSILAMNLTRELERSFGTLSKTLFFEYRSVRELAGYFLQSHEARLRSLVMRPPAGEAPAGEVPVPVSVAQRAGRRRAGRGQGRVPESAAVAEPIAIIGLSGRYPQALNVQQYWENLKAGKDCITEVPAQRWDWREYYSEDRSREGSHYSKWGGFIEGVDEFDPLFFNISPREAQALDPQERIFLQHAWMAVEDAGYTRQSLQIAQEQDLAGQVGVYVGVMYSEYQLYGAEAGVRGQRTAIAGSFASIANRVSYVLNLHGPSMTLDTMCSSSLTAIHVACQDLRLKRTQVAIAGGVNVSIHPAKYLMLSAGQFISSAGQCQSFGEGGDGYIPGEGAGAVVLKRLSQAQRDGDHIYGIIRGSALTHGGKTNGYTVPNPQAQSSAISRALREAQVDARHISYIEAHGTGTKLGDPIEIAALSAAFGQYTAERGFCLIGSAKSNIGHCESAAGIAGLTKVLLQMQHGQIVPSLHASSLNPHIDFPSTPFVVNQALRTWESPLIEGRAVGRIAGISSFGAGGSNAHMIVEEYREQALEPGHGQAPGEPLLIVLSARTPEQLQQKAQELLSCIGSQAAPRSLAAVAYTLQVGREAMQERLGLLAATRAELLEKLQGYVERGEQALQVYRGQAKRTQEGMGLLSQDEDMREAVGKWIARKKHAKLLELWVQGLEVPWSTLYGAQHPPLVSLPTYPFAKERYWISRAAEGGARFGALQLHPLLHENTSDLSEQSYRTRFSGEEFYLSDHRVRLEGQLHKVLPAVVYLEMARAAVERASGAVGAGQVLELRETVWLRPVRVDGERALSIALEAQADGAVGYEIYSEEGAQDSVVHCQGRAVYVAEPAVGRVDVAALRGRCAAGRLTGEELYGRLEGMGLSYGAGHRAIEWLEQGAGELCARLSVPLSVQGEWQQYGLHPSLLDGALQAGAVLLGHLRPAMQTPAACSVQSIRINSPCTATMYARVRASVESIATDDPRELDIDLCDLDGQVLVQLRRVGYEHDSIPSSAVDPSPRTQALPPSSALAVALTDLATPALDTASGALSVLLPRPAVALEDPSATSIGRSEDLPDADQSTAVRLSRMGDGIFSLHLQSPADDNTLSATLATALLAALAQLRQEPGIKVVLLRGGERVFLAGGREHLDAATRLGLYSAIVSFPHPLVALVRGDAAGAGLLVAALCDFMVLSKEAHYSYLEPLAGSFPTVDEGRILEERFGTALARDFACFSSSRSGADLQSCGWTCPIVPEDEVETFAVTLAKDLASKPRKALECLKHHMTRQLRPLVEGLKTAPAMRALEPASHAASDAGVLTVTLPDLLRTLHDAGAPSGCTGVVLAGDFSTVGDAAASIAGLRAALLETDVPLIAVLDGGARDDAWLIAQCCDVCVYANQGIYTAGVSPGGRLDPTLTRFAGNAFAHRLGQQLGREVLLAGRAYTGAELKRRAPTLVAVDAAQAMEVASQLASAWSRIPVQIRRAWRSGSDAALGSIDHAITPASDQPIAAPGRIALRSRFVTADVLEGGVVVVGLEDREAKNMFSAALTDGMREVFAHIDAASGYKVVIVTGYGHYFASGGSRDTLLAIHSGAAKFTDNRAYDLPLRCRLPVIAAMQGNAIGAGWSLGMFADFIMFAADGAYVSPYLEYGFTPGAGSTLVFPDRLGYDLAREILFTASRFTGRELKGRGMAWPVVPQDQVYAAALDLARDIARAPRQHLLEYKETVARSVRQALEEIYRLELEMHAATFVGQPEILERIGRHFMADASGPVTAAPSVMPPVSRASQASVIAVLRSLLAGELDLRESDVREDVQFIDLGLDSVSGVTWMRKINQRYGTSIEATKIYSHPTLRELGGYVSAQVGEERGLVRVPGVSVPVAAPSAVERVVARGAQRPLASRRAGRRSVERGVGVQSAAQPIAVIGLAGQFPGARDLQQYWENLAAGRDCVGEVPGERWDTGTYYRAGKAVAGKTNSRWLGALQEYDRFDPLFFNISPSEAQSMDPQQRLFLQTCWQGIEHAGYDARALSGSKCGVFVGCASGDYHQGSQRQRLSAQGFTGAANSILAARISYFLNLQGPCLAIDTACSSSLVAIANGCDSLRMGASDWVLAGGVYVMAGPEMHIRTAQAGMLSAQGRCFAFDQRADGFVPGEGVGVVVLKRLADAQRDGDTIYSVIRGWGVNQDGKTNGITAPNPAAQARLQQEVYERHGIDPGKIELLEAHGTGTQLGDPIEVQGLKESFGKYTRRQGYCALGSVKSNIGHCLTAAGVAGFIKLVLALRHRQLPPTIHFEKLNEHIELAGSPFYINSELREWHSSGDEPRQAAVSSFGFGGTNAHLVLQEHRAEPAVRWGAVRGEDAAMIVPLSARSAPQLRQRAADLLRFIQAPGQGVDLRELAYTLQVGRQAMEHRAAFTTPSLERLAAQLQDFLDGNGDSDGMFRGQAPQDKERLAFFNDDEDVNQVIVERWLAKRRHAKLAAAWAQGLDFDWNILHENQKPQRIALPLYPFAKDRYWIDQQSPTDPASVGSAAFLHPLVHVNMSDFDGQRYRSTFNGEEFFLADHQLRTQGATVEKVLPGVAYLEMVRVAVADALKQWPGSLELRDTVWVKPLAVSGSKDVFVALSAVLDEDSQEQLHYRVYSSSSSSEEVDHCKGRVTFCTEAPPTQIDLAAIRRAMNAAQLDGDEVYAALDDSGLHYGPAHRGVALIHCGEGQLLAQLRLPSLLESGAHDYVLHPSMMDSAIQSLMGLNGFLPQSSATPWVPFALEHVQVVAPCVTQMLAWARHSPGTRAGSGVTRVDIDLCDLEGNVRVLMRGFTLRKLDKPAAGAQSSGAFDGRFYESLIDRIVDKEISVEEAIGLE